MNEDRKVGFPAWAKAFVAFVLALVLITPPVVTGQESEAADSAASEDAALEGEAEAPGVVDEEPASEPAVMEESAPADSAPSLEQSQPESLMSQGQTRLLTEDTAEGLVIVGVEGSVPLGVLEIPAEINGVPVVGIIDHAFQGNLEITEVSIAGPVSVGEFAFQGSAVEKLTAPEVTEIGRSAFAQTPLREVNLADAPDDQPVTIGEEAFRDTQIDELELGAVDSIDTRAFYNAQITGDIRIEEVKRIEDEAFGLNAITSATLDENLEFLGQDVFADNGGWVEISSTAPDSEFATPGVVETTAYDEAGTGQVLNPVVVTVRYVDEDGNTIMPPDRLGADLSNDPQVFGKNQESTLEARSIGGYEPLTPTVSFTPEEDTYEIELVYRRVNQDPVISFPRNYRNSYPGGTEVTAEMLLQGVTARDYQGNDITNRLRVSPAPLTGSGGYTVTYTVVDSEGNPASETREVTVGMDWAEWEYAPGWQIKDFSYSGNVLTGFSPSGQAKAETATSVAMPPVNTAGTPVTQVGENAFNNRLGSITEVTDWGNISSIQNSAFRNNSLTKLPDTWGSVANLGLYVFANNDLTSLPESWGNIRTIPVEAFRSNGLKELPRSWGNVTFISTRAFYGNKLEKLPDSWGGYSKRC